MEKDINYEEISLEELREIVHKTMNQSDDNEYSEEEQDMIFDILNKSFSVEEAIQMKKENDILTKSSFDACKGTYKSVALHRNKAIRMLYFAKIHLIILRFKSIVINNGAIEYFDNSVQKVKKTNSIIRQEKELLNNIKNSIEELSKNQIPICNQDISILLVLIYNLNHRLLLDLEDYIKTQNMELRGIDYYGNKKFKEDIDTLENKIDEYTLKLGLSK